MEKIKIAITGRVASVVALPEVVADNAEYEVDFALDPREGWDMALPITALFVRRDGSYTARILDAGETSCTMPPQTGTNIVFVGLTQDDLRTTTPATIKVHRSIRTVTNDPLPAPTEDVYAQILAAYAGIKILSGKGAPTSATQGAINQLYRDEDTQRLYICTATDGGYTWAAVSGGSVDVDATLTKAGYAADAKAAGDAIGKKLDATALPTAINDALAQAKASGEFDGAKGERGDKGEPGAQGIRGEKGETGPEGPKGTDGKDGAGFKPLGFKNSASDLPATANPGEAYFVGTASPYDVYVWSGTEWKNIGAINGIKGEDGRGIVSIIRTSGNGTSGSTDTYTITYSDTTTSTFPVYNGKDGAAGAKGDTGATGAKGADGRGIVSITRTSGNGAAGTVDTYTIKYSDATTSTFSVRNGADGTAAGITIDGTVTPTGMNAVSGKAVYDHVLSIMGDFNTVASQMETLIGE